MAPIAQEQISRGIPPIASLTTPTPNGASCLMALKAAIVERQSLPKPRHMSAALLLQQVDKSPFAMHIQPFKILQGIQLTEKHQSSFKFTPNYGKFES